MQFRNNYYIKHEDSSRSNTCQLATSFIDTEHSFWPSRFFKAQNRLDGVKKLTDLKFQFRSVNFIKDILTWPNLKHIFWKLSGKFSGTPVRFQLKSDLTPSSGQNRCQLKPDLFRALVFSEHWPPFAFSKEKRASV